jgi:hypothetical protein
MDNLFDFVDAVLENCVFDLTYHEKIKPLSNEEEEIYFQQAVDRIHGARQALALIYTKSLQEKELKKKRSFFDILKSILWKSKNASRSLPKKRS